MTFREDFPLFWAGVLGVLIICGLLSWATDRSWNDFTWLGSLAAAAYVGLYTTIYGLPK